MGRSRAVLAAALAATLIAGCTPASGNDPVAGAAAPPPVARAGDHPRRSLPHADDPGRQHRLAGGLARPDGTLWLIATAKATDKLVVYDGSTGRHLRDVGSSGTGPGQFDRPNGIAVTDDLLWIVERDNHRVQVLSLPDFAPLATFAAGDLRKPYGLWVDRRADGYSVYVTDSWDNGEDAQGRDILPPLAELDKRVRQYHVTRNGAKVEANLVASIGDTTEAGALRVVESIWGDPRTIAC